MSSNTLRRVITGRGIATVPRVTSTLRARPVAGAEAKLYLTDPLLATLPSRLRTGLPEPDMTGLTEMTIGVALARAIDDLEEGRWAS